MSTRVHGSRRGFWRQEQGAEVVQLALLIPILLGVVLTVFYAFELFALRSKMRSTASQMAQYITTYAIPPENTEAQVPDLCDGLRAIVYGNFYDAESNVGEPIVPRVTLYVINDPTNPRYDESNRTPVDCRTMADRLQVNQQFVVELEADANWLWLEQDDSVFWRWTQDVRPLPTMVERAFGVAPGEPWFVIRNVTYANLNEGPGGCTVDVMWDVEGSFLPNAYQPFLDGDLQQPLRGIEYNPDMWRFEALQLPAGQTSTIMVVAYCGDSPPKIVGTALTGPIRCHVPEPTPTP